MKNTNTAVIQKKTRPAFVVDCKDCGKVQAASVAENETVAELKKATDWLEDAEQRNGNSARRLAVNEEIPDISGWCDCKSLRLVK